MKQFVSFIAVLISLSVGAFAGENKPCMDEQCGYVTETVTFPGLFYCIYEGHYYINNGNWPCQEPGAIQVIATPDNATEIVMGLYNTGYIELPACEPKRCYLPSGRIGTCLGATVAGAGVVFSKPDMLIGIYVKDCVCSDAI